MSDLPAIPTNLGVVEFTKREPSVRADRMEVAQKRKQRRTRIEAMCETALKQASAMVKLMTYEEMNLVFKMETYFERNKHLGIHWYRQLHILIDKYRERWEAEWKEYNTKKNLID
jgi:predicted AlkP superfamily phosphohydrolase/phosphomutase